MGGLLVAGCPFPASRRRARLFTRLWVLPFRRRGPPLVADPKFNERGGAFSPDGKSFAYVSDMSGRDEVYVEPFPGPGERVPISSDGGLQPVWSRDRRELFYRQGDALMAVPVATRSISCLRTAEAPRHAARALRPRPIHSGVRRCGRRTSPGGSPRRCSRDPCRPELGGGIAPRVGRGSCRGSGMGPTHDSA